MGSKTLVVAAVAVLMAQGLRAEEGGIELDKIVVTPSRYSQEISEAPDSISVISQGDISNSEATSPVDLLRSVPGIVVRDVYGNAAKASVDLRGFGDMDAMNTLVLIDGRRVNEVDLSGVDWSQIPLDQVERIEVIRGGNSVLYGENAVGGVINIITKKGKGKPKFEIGNEYGSYDKNSEKINLSGSENKLSYFLSASREGNNGYRNNSFFKTYDYGSKLEYDFTDDFSAHFSSGFHRATYGLPGALSEADIRNFGRRFSKNGDDRATDKDYYFMSGAKKEFIGLGEFCLDLSYRIKHVNSDLIGGNGGFNPIRISNIETFGLNPKFTVNKAFFGKENTFTTGLDFYRSLFKADDLDTTSSPAALTRIHKESLGGYLEEEFFILENLSASGGFRYEAVGYSFNSHDFSGFNPDIGSRISPNEKAYNFGLNYKYAGNSNVFFNINQSFRFPAIDEFFNGSTLNTALTPQVSHDMEAGVRHDFNGRLHAELSLYRMKITDELFTDPSLFFGLGATSNYPKTIHRGIDASVNYKAMHNLSFYGSYSYQDPQFDKGSFKGKTIPWVPNYKANIGARYAFLKGFTARLEEYYTGSRFRINDVNNTLPKVKGYFTTDIGLSYAYKDFTISANINNLFNEYYYEFASVSAFSGNKAYYPAPGRNFGLKLDYKF